MGEGAFSINGPARAMIWSRLVGVVTMRYIRALRDRGLTLLDGVGGYSEGGSVFVLGNLFAGSEIL